MCVIRTTKEDFKEIELGLFEYESDEKPWYSNVIVCLEEDAEYYFYKVIQELEKYRIVTM